MCVCVYVRERERETERESEREFLKRQTTYLVGVSSDRDPECPTKSKVCQFNSSLLINEQILWLEVTVENSS